MESASGITIFEKLHMVIREVVRCFQRYRPFRMPLQRSKEARNFQKSGEWYFFGVHNGTIVAADIRNLPDGNAFHGFHIHEGTCQGTKAEPFAQADGHYNPTNAMHPQHAGDMPSLLANDGNAFLIFYTDRFHPEDVIGRAVIIHAHPDDMTTQPSGNSGAMIACGEIREMKAE